MAKNIAVIDAQGNQYEPTWPKRAKGLVKSGRARFVNDLTICLASPPRYTEGNSMNENLVKESCCSKPDETKESAASLCTQIFHKIDLILNHTQYLQDAIAQMENVEEDVASIIAQTVTDREKTNQSMIELLQNMADCLKPQPKDPGVLKLEALQNLLADSELDENHKFDLLNQAVQKLF